MLPAALRLIQGARTKENLLAAFSTLNPGILTSIPKAQCSSATDTACISDVAVALFNLRNPVTGDFVIPAPREGLAAIGPTISSPGLPSEATRSFVSATSCRPSSSRISTPPSSTVSSRRTSA